MERVLFQAPSSSFDPAFWEELYNLKLNVLKLDSSKKRIVASVKCSDGRHSQPISFSADSYGQQVQAGAHDGVMMNANTPEEFKNLDKKELLLERALELLSAIISNEAIADTRKLLTFLLLTYADLKTYRFTYWVAVPAIIPAAVDSAFLLKPRSVNSLLKTVDPELLVGLYKCLGGSADAVAGSELSESMKGEGSNDIVQNTAVAAVAAVVAMQPVFVIKRHSHNPAEGSSEQAEGSGYSLLTLMEALPLLGIDSSLSVVIVDSSSSNSSTTSIATATATIGFSWMLRNLLAALSLHILPAATTEPSRSSNQKQEQEQARIVRIIGFRGTLASKMYNCLSGDTAAYQTNALMQQLRDFSNAQLVESDCSTIAEVNVRNDSIQSLRREIEAALGLELNASVSTSTSTAASTSASAAASAASTAAAAASSAVNSGGHSNTSSDYVHLLRLAYSEGKLPSLKTVGWETNERGKPGPRVADLSQALDSRFLMRQAVNLNLRLMKWRVWPTLNTEKLAQTRCLLLGAGTLGCAVARSLLGWGVRSITLVDSGRVSYSNPSRQCLFEFTDCEQRRFKANAAADHLKRIFPDVDAKGVVMTIAMPGHPLDNTVARDGEERSIDEAAYLQLQELIQSHDVCFALTDSREARWLPTVMCAASNKLLINAALGFDSYLVMRHGLSTAATTTAAATGDSSYPPQPPAADHESNNTAVKGIGSSSQECSVKEKLGCYFCNDVVAATNSQKDRSMDQQCTVTRPGLSFIAAAQCVELMVALLMRIDGSQATETTAAIAYSDKSVGDDEGRDDGAIPHQIRGSLAGFTQLTLKTPAFSCCTACSSAVVEEYQRGGFAFLQRVCQDSSILEDISGVGKLNEMVDLDLCIDSDEDF